MTSRKAMRNISFLKQEASSLLGSTSLTVKVICCAVLFGYCLSFSESAVKSLTVTPAYLFPPVFWIWTAFTHWMIEFHLYEVVTDVIVVGLCGKLIEPLWGKLEMVTYFALVNMTVAIIGTVFYVFVYMVTFNSDYLFQTRMHGLSAYVASVMVAVKQIMPDNIVVKTPAGKIMNRNIPLCVLLVSILFWIVGLLEHTYPVMYGIGMLVSWIYLRFYQQHSNGTRGDLADNFSFASFFPTVLQPPISVFSNLLFRCLVSVKICKKPIRKYDIGAPSSIAIRLPGMDAQDAERRRQIALKALGERLGKQEPSWKQSKSPVPEISPQEDYNQTIPLEPKQEELNLPAGSVKLTIE
nr:EOG090X06Q3 [Artemia franciscana]